MRSLMGVLYALGGAVAGFFAGVAAALFIAKVTNASNREGAIGYLAMAVGIIGAVIGLGAGIMRYTKSAPVGQGASYGGSTVLGLLAIVAVIALGIWLRLYTMERPAEYDGSMASLELELRVDSADFPADYSPRWLGIEVQTSTTRPEGTVLDRVRDEGRYKIIPVIQQPVYRAGWRVIVVNVRDRQSEAFMPKMGRLPRPSAEWSEWIRPQRVDPPYGVEPKAPLRPLFELRWRVRRFGE